MDASIYDLYGGDLTSDAQLVLKEEAATGDDPVSSVGPGEQELQDSAGDHQKVSCIAMPVHRAVLWPLSDYFQSKFKNWSNTDSKPQIIMHIPNGQMHIGRMLVTAMYSQLPDQLSQQELLQLLILAESYKIDKVTGAVVSRISSMPLDKLEWGTVLAAEQLPTDNPLYAPVTAAAEARFMQLLGDLEVVWALENEAQRKLLQKRLTSDRHAVEHRAQVAVKLVDGRNVSELCFDEVDRLTQAAAAAQEAAAAAVHSSTPPHELLLQLPFNRLLQLLQHKDLKAASENAVYYTAKRWLQHNEATSQQKLQLASLLRLQNCSPNYLINEVLRPDSSWALQHLPAAELQRLSSTVTEAVSKSHKSSHLLQCKNGTKLSEHGPSALSALDLQWKLPVTDIQAAYEQAAQDQRGMVLLFQYDTVRYSWQGVQFGMMFAMHIDTQYVEEEDDTADVFSMFLELHTIPGDGGLAKFSSSVTVWKAVSSGRVEYLKRDVANGSGEDDAARVYLLVLPDMVDGDYLQPNVEVQYIGLNWPEVEQELRRRKLVHSDGCLHATAQVTQLN